MSCTCGSDEHSDWFLKEPMTDLKLLLCIYGMVAAVMLAVFCGVIAMKTLNQTEKIIPVRVSTGTF